jgi:hypothetical protein
MRTATIILLALPISSLASGDKITQSNDMNNQTAGNVAIGDTIVDTNVTSEALAFAHALGDVDINQCLASTQWGTIVVSKQKVILNKWCAAEVYDAKGMYDMAARMRCDINEIAKFFDSNAGCVTSNTYIPPEPTNVTGNNNQFPPPPVTPPLPTMDLAEIEDEHDEEINALRREIYQQRVDFEIALAEQPSRPPVLTREQAQALKVKK